MKNSSFTTSFQTLFNAHPLTRPNHNLVLYTKSNPSEKAFLQRIRQNLSRIITCILFLSMLFGFFQSEAQTVTKQLYLSEGQNLDRIDPVSTLDATTSFSPILSSVPAGVVAANTSSASSANPNSTTFTLSHTVGTGSNRLLMVGISQKNKTITGVTYGGTAMTLLDERITGTNARIHVYYMIAPPSGTADVVVTLSANPDKGIIVGATTFTGVNQAGGASTFGTWVENNLNNNTATIAATSATGELVYGVVAYRNTNMTLGAGQTSLWNIASGGEMRGGASTEPGAASVTMSWTGASSQDWAIGAVSIKPAAAINNTTFTMGTPLCSALTIKAGTAITVQSYVTVNTGTMPASPSITALLKYGATNIINLTSAAYNSGTGIITWTGTLGADVTVPAGQAIAMVVTTAQAGVTFTMDFDSQTKPSKINLPVSTYINVNSFNIYSAVYPGGSIVNSSVAGATRYARAVVSDPFGFSDITALNITINPGSTVAATSVATSGCTRTYEYAWTTPGTANNYTLTAVAKEGTENTVTHSKVTNFSTCVNCPPVAVNDSSLGGNGATQIIDVLANDYDPNNNIDSNSITIIDQPSNGSAVINNKKIVYIPIGSFNGFDTIVYRICDLTSPTPICDTATVIAQVDPAIIDPCSDAVQNKVYYLPYPENQAAIALDSMSSVANTYNTIRTVISLAMPYPGMIIRWDHWEDGFEADINFPSQSTTLIWGDGNPYNGIAPGYPTDIIPAGAGIVLDNTMSIPRSTASIFFDGGDKITSPGQIAVTQVCGLPSVIGLQCMKNNVTNSGDYGTSFTIPVGQNFPSRDFRYTSLFIRAAQNTTIINVDKDNNGSFETKDTINAGETMFVNGGVLNGAVVTSTKPVGVDICAGGNDNYSSRQAAIFPASWYSNVYYSPVPTVNSDATNQDTAAVYLYNSFNSAMTINWNSGAPASGSISIPAKSTVRFPMALSQTKCYKFQSANGNSFTAIQVCDSYTDNNGNGNSGSTFDWSFNLISEARLTDFATIAWAPGSTDGTQNDGPIWVTPNANTTIYVKYDGNVLSGSLTSPCGLKYDSSFVVNHLNYKRLRDNDNDQSGIAIWTCDGAKFAAVYGEDASTASTANPSWDVGTVVLPFCRQKLVFAVDDIAITPINQPVTIPILKNDAGFLGTIDPSSISTTGLLQPLHGTVTINPNGTVNYTPNTGYIGKDTFQYQVCSTPSPVACDKAYVYVSISACPAGKEQNLIYGQIFLDKNKDGLNNDGGTGIFPGKVYLYADGNCNTTIETGELRDSVSVDSTGYYQFVNAAEKTIEDNFDGTGGTNTCATGSDGSNAWLTNWVDAGDASSGVCASATGDVESVLDGAFGYALRLKNASRSATRQVNIQNANAAFLTYSYRRKSTTFVSTDAVYVQVSTNGSTFAIIDSINGNAAVDASYQTVYNLNISSYVSSGTTYVRFLTKSSNTNSDSVYVDNIKIYYTKYPQCYIVKLDPNTVPTNYNISTASQYAMTFTNDSTCQGPNDFGIRKNTVTISGTLFNDVNGMTDNIVNGTAIDAPSSTTMYAYLVNSSGIIQFKDTLNNGNGTYSFPNADILASYTVVLSTTNLAVLATAPSSANLPSGWVSTGEAFGTNNGAGTGNEGGISNVSIPVTTTTLNVTNVNFGIEQLPTPLVITATTQVNPGGSTCVTVPPATFGATDPSSGTITSIRITSFPINASSITINGTSYDIVSFPVGGVVVPTNASGQPTQAICVDPDDGALMVSIPYAPTDNAGKEGPTTGLAKLPFFTVSLSGNVFNDVNGLTDAIVNGTGIGNPSAVPLFANLLDGSDNVVNVVSVNNDGSYSFPEVDPGNYKVQITIEEGIFGQPAPATSLPTNWVNTGENLGVAAGNDGTVNGILTGITVVATNVVDANFGIEELPTPSTITATSQVNPGGTNNVTVPPATFGGTDPSSGTITSLTITSFPTNATTITINGTTYTSGTFPGGGVTVPTTPNGEPTQAITVDPIDGAVTVGISYTVTDNAGKTNPTPGIANIPFFTVGLSGTVFNDVNGLTDLIVNGVGLGNPSSTTMYVNLLDGGGNVRATTTVNNNGTYNFPTVDPGSYTTQLSSVQGTVGQPAPATSLPTNWVNTGENLGVAAGNDGTVNGLLTGILVVSTNVVDANFGIEELPAPLSITAPTQVNPGGTNHVTVPPATFGGTDPSSGTIISLTITSFPTNATSITINGTTYTSGTFPGSGVTIPTNTNGQPTQSITVDPIDGAVTVGISYTVTDNAGQTNPIPGIANVPFFTVGLSGTVFNDVNGLTDAIVNGSGLGNPSSTTLYANLLSSGNVVATTIVNVNGTYNFPIVDPGAYSMQISENQGAVGQPAPATSLPTNWVNTGENLGVAAGNDGTVNGILTGILIEESDVLNANFGIEELPTPSTITATSQVNPGGTNNVTVPPATFGGTDPSSGTITSLTITSFPSNATTITINGTTYTSGTFPGGGVTVPTTPNGEPTQSITVDPIDGAVTVGISYTVTDNAGKTNPTPGIANIPFFTVGLSGTVFNDVDGLTDATVNGVGLGDPSSTTMYVNLLDGGGNVRATTTVNVNGTYNFPTVDPGSYTTQLSSVQGTVGQPAPATSLPTNWVNTGENLGVAAGNDGTVNGILTGITVVATNVVDANFGIEELPTPSTITATSQVNPGGTNNVTVPPTTFGGTDPNSGTITSLTITSFPTNATTITINGTTYTSGTFPGGGVTVPTTPNGEPTQAITVDPIDGAVTVGISYTVTDNAGKTNPTPGIANIPFFTVGLSGTVFNDVDGLTDATVNGVGLGNPSSTTMYVNLLDGGGNVRATTTVNVNGTYNFPTVDPGSYTTQLSSVQGTVGQPAPATSLPTNWVNTGENLGVAAGNDGTVNGILTGITVVATNVVDANFGIEELPTPSTITATSQVNPGGTNNVTVPPTTFGGTDPSSGTITSLTITSFPTNATTITINGTTYTSGTFPGGGVTVPTTPNGEPTQAITVDPIDGAVTVGISYTVTDNAGKTNPTPGIANIPFFTVGLSGTVFNDVDGLTDATVNGVGLGNPSSTTMYVNLLDGGGNVRATTTVNVNGTYNFPTVDPGSYTTQLSSIQGTVGQPAPATSLPTNWVNTGENLGVAAGNDGTVNGILTGITVVATDVVDANFGIEELPTPSTITATSQVNPGGTNNVTVPPATFGGTDPSSGTITSLTITSFPSNATTITINGTTYTSGTFPGGGVTVPTTPNGEPTQAITVDPIDGAVTVGISYTVTDNAGKTNPTPGIANIPFFTVGLSGTVFNDVNGLTDLIVNGVGLGNPSSTTMYVNLLDGGGNVRATTTVNNNGTYNFPTVDPGSYTTQLSSVQGIVGQPAPATSLPTNWVNTGENLGVAAGNDGTVNGILTGITVVATNVVDANFGIEQLPNPSVLTAPSQVTRGGTTQVVVPPATFNPTDADGGIVTQITITSFPSNINSIVINGTTYTSGTFPIGGVIVPTNVNGEPTQVITIDPVDGVMTVVIPYSATDNAGMTSTPTGIANVPFGTVGISGTVFNDVNGLTDVTVNGIGLGNPSTTTLYANLLDGLNNVVATTTVNANGTYTFATVYPGTYSIQVSINQGTVGQPAPATSLPTNWVNTGENLGVSAGNDGTVNGILTGIIVVATNVVDANFGIEELPTPSTITATSQVNPGGTTSVTVPPATFGATDPSSGTITSITITSFPTNATTITINGTTYTSGTFPGGGVTVPTTTNGEPTQAITVDPIDGAVTVGISYSATDNAGMTSTPSGVANVPFFTVGLSGTVFNDVDGLTDLIVNGVGLGNPSSTTMYVNLLDGGGNVRATTTVNNNGTYNFPTVDPGSYTTQLSSVQGTIGQPAPATSLPTNWVNTGENLGVAAGNDGTVNGILTGITVVATNVVDANFGIEQLPNPSVLTAPSQINPGGTTQVVVPPATFNPTDADGGIVTQITITSFPSNINSIVINGTTYTSVLSQSVV
ncbi:MAG: hypothetical protein IPI46_13225 [Bacteroidetes bacterium]|nr:hypothetical protein [Bacteroidota bacterium]